MRVHDVVCGAALLLVAVFLFAYAQTIPPMPGQKYGADVFPILVSLGLGGFSLLLTARGWRARRPGEPWIALAPWARDPYTLGNFLLALAVIVVYVLLEETVGFIPLAIAILLVLFLKQGVPLRRSAIVAVVATLTIQFAFSDLLRVPLPRGILTDWLW
jgi:putative tricarboxylic transport membrane protein